MNLPAKKVRGLPADYDPERGLKTMAAAEAAEQYYRRAKDVRMLNEAVMRKLVEQRNFVLWWDEQKKAQGARRDLELRFRSETKFQAGKDGIPDRLTLHRWRVRLKDPEKFEQTRQRCSVSRSG